MENPSSQFTPGKVLRRLRRALAICSAILVLPACYGIYMLCVLAASAQDVKAVVAFSFVFLFTSFGFVLMAGYWHLPRRFSFMRRAWFWYVSAGYNVILLIAYMVPAFYYVMERIGGRSGGYDAQMIFYMMALCYIGGVILVSLALGRSERLARLREQEELMLAQAMQLDSLESAEPIDAQS